MTFRDVASLSLRRSPVQPIGLSLAFRQVMTLVDKIAPSDKAVLICGPTGAGKEIIAQELHHRSQAVEHPFVDLNCAAIPEHLIEAELFGYSKGAFTGAQANRTGLLTQVGQGTLFLDEIGEMPLSLQPKLLRVLETRCFRPLGSTENHYFAGRVIAATHRDLEAAVRDKTFREDLFYRLSVFVLTLPGLDQRRDDIPVLISHFASMQARPLSFTPEAIQQLTISDWPGHIRQLRSFVDRLAVLADDTVITTEILSQFQKIPHGHGECSDVSALADALLRLPETNKLMAAEQLLLNRALQLCEGNKSAAARMLGVGRKVVERNLAVGEDQENALQRVLEEGHRFIMDAEYASAIKVLQQGLVRLHGLSAQENQLLHFQLLQQLGSAYSALQGWSSSDALGCYEKALLVGKDLDCEDEKASIQFGIWTTQLMSLELDKARNTAQQMLLCAGKTHASIDAHFVMANTLFWLGDHAEVLACLERSGLLTDLEQQQIGSQGFDISGLVLTFEGLSAFQLGQFQRAHHALLSLVKRHHRNTDLPFSRAIALQGTVWLACLFEEDDLLATSSLELETISKTHGFEFYHGVGMFFRGCHLSMHGDKAAAEAAMLEGYENYMLCHGGKLFHSFQAWKRIELLLNSERYLESDQLAAHALDMAIAHKERAYLGELLIVRARARWALGDLDAAEQGFYSALTTSEALGVIPAQLNAGIYLAQLLQQSGRSTHALGLLTKVLGSCDKRSCGNPQSDDWHPVVERAHHLLAQLQQVGSSVTSL